jgi:DNA-binding FadR family transcriptional regulator
MLTNTSSRRRRAGAGVKSEPVTAQTRRKALRIHGSIAWDLGKAIISQRYLPGELLDGEIIASERLKVSRTAYREAVRILAAKGLVQPRPKVGTVVSPQEQWHWLDPDVLSWIFQSEPPNDLLSSLYDLRQIIEPAAAALASLRRNAADLQAMSDALERMELYSLADERGQQADQDFHSTLLRATGNVFLVSLVNGIGAAVRWTTIFKQRKSPLPRNPQPEHQRVHQAIAAADPQAARKAMEELVSFARLDTNNSLSEPKRTHGKSGARKRSVKTRL